jgi:homoserine O-acetyltransferase/O-succinyltransferase
MRRLTHTQSHEPTVPLGRITAKIPAMSIDEDMFFPLRDCRAEQETTKGSELRDITTCSVTCLFGVSPTCMLQVDRRLGGLLATPV